MTIGPFQFLRESKSLFLGEKHSVSLNGRKVPYILKRCRRKTIGMRINADGLFVSTPLKESLRWIELVLRDKACWILKKLDEWEKKQSSKLLWEETTTFPLLAEPWKLLITAPGKMKMIKVQTEFLCRQFTLPFSPMLTSQQVEKIVMSWYYKRALIFFSKRIALYAIKLGVPQPQLRLSRAKNQWGSCDSRGIVHLNWQLIQMPPHLIDYVVSHELSHLIEMNHSPAFWKIVESIYPNYLAARLELKSIG